MDLIHVQDAKMKKTKPARDKCYTAGSSCITNIVINNREAKIHIDSGAFCGCIEKDYLKKIYTNWQDKLIPIEGIKFSSSSQNMLPLGIFEAVMIFPHPKGSIRLKVEFVIMNNFTSQHFILGNNYLNIFGIDINNHKDREAFASDKEPLGAIKGQEVDIMLNVERPYPPLSRRPAYPASPRAREAL
ncbi:hypothetical protein O181_072192 [Austropuccinia psidii MF-1]|uniref:Retropepsins domain-containing protein n=1 Tax=Austropuccinia psidii MF-1 TaxID=1389203 RepID=A0A9Q3F6N0_9BASI|nr:hypothetical protein [Austropuccinia psidii MF-1]